MVEKIIVNPLNVRGHGNVVSSKTVEDFTTYNSSLSYEDSFYTMEFTESAITLSLVVSSGTVSVGEAVTCTATVLDDDTPVSGVSVSFYDGTTSLGTGTTNSSGVATYTTSSLSAGSHSLSAEYDDSTSNVVNVTVVAYDDIVLSADDSILSYYDWGFTILRAQLMDGSSTASVSGVTVEFFNGSTSMGTSQTDSNGVAVKTYLSAGEGDVSLKAECSNGSSTFVSETYTLHDYYWYGNTEYSSLTTLNKTLPSAFKVSFEFQPTSRSNASSYIEIGASTTNCFVIGQITSGGLCGVWERVNNNYSTTNPFSSNSTLNDWQEIVFTFDGTDWTCTLNGETITNSLDVSYSLETLLRAYPTSNNHLRNIYVVKL